MRLVLMCKHHLDSNDDKKKLEFKLIAITFEIFEIKSD